MLRARLPDDWPLKLPEYWQSRCYGNRLRSNRSNRASNRGNRDQIDEKIEKLIHTHILYGKMNQFFLVT